MYPRGTAPDSADVFDYEEPTTAGPRLLFSVQPIPPEQGTAKQLASERGSRAVTWLVLLTVAAALSLASRPVERFALLTALLWLAVRAPVGPALGLQAALLSRHVLPAAARPAVELRRRAGAGRHAAHGRRRLALAPATSASMAG